MAIHVHAGFKAGGEVDMNSEKLKNHSFLDIFMDVLAEDTNHVVAAEDLTAGTPIDCVIAAQPDVPRNVTITITDADTSITAFSITVAGVDAKNVAITENFVFGGGLVQTGDKAFAVISSVTVDSITGDDAGDVLDAGLGSKCGLKNPLTAAGDVYKVKDNNAHMDSGDYTVNTTNDTVDLSTGGAIGAGDDYEVWYICS